MLGRTVLLIREHELRIAYNKLKSKGNLKRENHFQEYRVRFCFCRYLSEVHLQARYRQIHWLNFICCKPKLIDFVANDSRIFYTLFVNAVRLNPFTCLFSGLNIKNKLHPMGYKYFKK